MYFAVHIRTTFAATVVNSVAVGVGDADFVLVGDDGDHGGVAQHAVSVVRLESFDEFVSDAAEAAGKNHALGRRGPGSGTCVSAMPISAEVSSVKAPQLEGP